MKWWSRLVRVILAVWMALLSLPHGLAYAEPPKPAILDAIGVDQRLDAQVPLDVVFRDEAWRSVTLGELLDGRPIILTLNYYNCKNICGTTLDDLVGKLGDISFKVGEQYRIVTLSINPRETPQLAAETKRAYVKRYPRPGVDTGWTFLTADEEAIKRVTEAVGFRYTYDPATGEYAHPAAFMVLTPKGRVSRYLYAPAFSATDLRLSVVEAADNKIGSLLDQVLLFCYRYDPNVGRYSVAILNAVRVGGLLTMLGVGVLLVMLSRREGPSQGPQAPA